MTQTRRGLLRNTLCQEALLWAILVVTCASHGLAQQAPLLGGQGVSPREEGVTEAGSDVMVSVELVKLVGVDQREYAFTAQLQVIQYWRDPRAAAAFKVINSAKFNNLKSKAKSRMACLAQAKNSLGLVSNTSTEACLAAASSSLAGEGTTGGTTGTCNRYCIQYGSTTPDECLCCDGVWIPDLDLRNLLDTSQDRVLVDRVLPLYEGASATDPEESKNLTLGKKVVGAWRLTRVLGRFSSQMSFQRYPFDTQNLKVLISEPLGQNDSYNLVAGATYRRLNRQFEIISGGLATTSGLRKDELAGWSINSLTLTCASSAAPNATLDAMVQPPTDVEIPLDPFGSFKRLCAFNIEISRLSNTALATSILPVLFISLLSFVVFFTRPDELDVRLSVEISLFLALTATQFVFHDMLPLTSYMTNLDVFILLSYSLILGIVAECLVVAYVSSRGEHKQRKGQTRAISTGSDKDACTVDEAEGSEESEEETPFRRRKTTIQKVAEVSMVITSALEEDMHFAYRLARSIDLIAAMCLFATYVVLTSVIFTVGLV